jgi:hypothetical protein
MSKTHLRTRQLKKLGFTTGDEKPELTGPTGVHSNLHLSNQNPQQILSLQMDRP